MRFVKRLNDRNRQVALGAALSYAAIAFNIISGFVYTPWMIRVIGKDQFALYTLALSVVNLFLLDFGISAAVTKYLSNFYAQKDIDSANRFIGTVYKVFFIISCVVAIILLFFYFFLEKVYVKLSPYELSTFKVLYLLVCGYSVIVFPMTTFNGILMASEKFVAVKLCNFLQKVTSVGLIVLFLFLNGNIYALVLVHAATNIFFSGVKYIIIRNKTVIRAKIKGRIRDSSFGLLSFSLWTTVSNIAGRCIFNLMPSLVAVFIGSNEVTIFSIAATLEGYVFTFSDAINGMFMPRISKIMYSDSASVDIFGLMKKVGRFHVYTIGLILLVFIVVGKDFMLCWMGPGYEMSYYCAVLLIIPSFFDVPQQVARTALLVKDHVKEQAYSQIAMAVVNILLSFVLLNRIGIIGAGISICVAYLVRTICMNYLYWKKLRINVICFFKEVYLPWIVPALGTILVGIYICNGITLDGWSGMILKSFILCMTYIASIAVGQYLPKHFKYFHRHDSIN